MTAINYRRGLLRVWLVASLGWILVIGFFALTGPIPLPPAPRSPSCHDPTSLSIMRESKGIPDPSPEMRSMEEIQYNICLDQSDAAEAAYKRDVSQERIGAVLFRLTVVFGVPLLVLLLSFAGVRILTWLRAGFRAG